MSQSVEALLLFAGSLILFGCLIGAQIYRVITISQIKKGYLPLFLQKLGMELPRSITSEQEGEADK